MTVLDMHSPMRDLTDGEWLQRIEELGEEAGYYEPLSKRHHAMLSDEGPILLVTFETRASIRNGAPDELPLGYRVARAQGWSSLTLISDEESWFRDPSVYAYVDRLVDEAFFEDFDRVVFYGEGSGGYAAAAFAVAAPGATVIAIQPQATLSPRLTGWDMRFPRMRRTSFTDRYGFAPDMIDGAGAAYILFDPHETLDAMHAAMFARPHVTLLPCRNLGGHIGWMLREMDILYQILTLACRGEFDALAFWRLYRARRDMPRYLRSLIARLEAEERPYLEALVCRHALERFEGLRIRARLTSLEDGLRAKGVALPGLRRIHA